MRDQAENETTRGRVWTFSHFRYEEVLCQLTRDGVPIQITDKPRDVLVCLLEAESRAVTADKLIETIWLGDMVTDHVLRTTVNALRKALGDEDREIIKTVHRLGYRMGVRVTCQVQEDVASPKLVLEAGDRVPGRPDWILETALDLRIPHAVWLTRHLKTKQVRVYKMAEDGLRLRGLQREMTLSRLFSRQAPRATCFVQVQDWQLDDMPYLLGTEFGGDTLHAWATNHWAANGLSQAVCLSVMAELCDAVDLAHEVGVFHNDLKPSNVLVARTNANGLWHVRLADFGISTLQDPRRLSEFDITGHGFDREASTTVSGSAMYLAPEVKPGQPPTRSSDIYALGVILFQLLSKDFRKTPVPGWEQAVDDPLLRGDIARAVELDPALRLKSAAELASSLRTLDARRAAKHIRQKKEKADEELRRRDQRSRARKPYLQALFVSLILGLSAAGWLYRKAAQERRTAVEINSFLTDDLLSELNPGVGQGADETLKQAIENVRPVIDSRFAAEPEVAARIHQTLALALDNAQDNGPASEEYDRAAADWIRVNGPLSQDALFQQYKHVSLEARSFSAGALDRARALQTRANATLQQVRQPWPKVRVVKLIGDGIIAMVGGKPKEAVNRYQEATGIAESSPEIPIKLRLTTQERLCSAEFRSEQAQQAEKCFRDVITQKRALDKADAHLAPEEVGLAQALLYQGKFADVIQQVNTAYPIVLKQLGPKAEYPMVLLGIRAQAEASLEEWDDAIRDDMDIAERAKKADPNSFPAIISLADLGSAECRSGRVDAGEGHLREALKAIDSPGRNPGFIGAIKEELASCLVPSNPGQTANPARLDEAEHLLNSINVSLVSGSVGDAQWGANVDLARGQIAFLRGQYALAAKYLEAAKAGFSSPQADPYQNKVVDVFVAALASMKGGP